jgi:hypothetical protein
MTAEDEVNDRRGGHRRLAACMLALLVALATVSGASANSRDHATLTTAEHAFAKAYTALVPRLNKASDAIVFAVSNAGKDTDAQIVTVFTNLAKKWTTATRPLLALKAPAADASLFAAVTHYVPVLEADLLATAQAGRTHNAKAGTQAGRHIARDFNGLGAAVKVLKHKLGLL